MLLAPFPTRKMYINYLSAWRILVAITTEYTISSDRIADRGYTLRTATLCDFSIS